MNNQTPTAQSGPSDRAIAQALIKIARDYRDGTINDAEMQIDLTGYARTISTPPAGARDAVTHDLEALAVRFDKRDQWMRTKTAPNIGLADAFKDAAADIRALAAQPAPVEMSPEFTDTARGAISWVLWHHQGGSSPIGQPLRFALGMGQHDELPEWRITDAKRYAELTGATTADFHRKAQPAPGVGGDALAGKYGDVLRPFLALMERELHANASKGDRPGWLAMTPAVALLEIYYHVSKLQKAVKNSDGDKIIENAADVANMAMMLLDVCGGLDVQALTTRPAESVAQGGDAMGHRPYSQGCALFIAETPNVTQWDWERLTNAQRQAWMNRAATPTPTPTPTPATGSGGEAVGCLTISRWRGVDAMVNHDFDYYGNLPDGSYSLYTHPAPAGGSGGEERS